MLPIHKTHWENHSTAYVKYTIVDDCSPKLITLPFTGMDCSVYRVKEDIPWNIAGARNLSFHVAETEWIFLGDIDHIVTTEALKAMLSLDKSDPNVVYTFARKTPEGDKGVDAYINFLMNKKRFFEVGGYDEDYSGRYGREETFFYHCLRAHRIKIEKRDDISLLWYPKLGATKGLVRDKSENAIIFDKKMIELKSGTYKNGPILRFQWEKFKQ